MPHGSGGIVHFPPAVLAVLSGQGIDVPSAPQTVSILGFNRSGQTFPLNAISGANNYLTQVSIRINEKVDDSAATTAFGPVYAEVWLIRGNTGMASMLDSGYCFGGYGQYRSIVGGCGAVGYATGDKVFVELSNLTGTTTVMRVDVAAVPLEGAFADTWSRLSSNVAPNQGTRMQAISIPDRAPYDPQLTADRGLWSRQPTSMYSMYPQGRVCLWQDFEAAPTMPWGATAGAPGRFGFDYTGATAPTRVTTFTHSGAGAMSLTTANTDLRACGANIVFPLIADRPIINGTTTTQQECVTELWFTPYGATKWKDFTIGLEVDDGVQKWLAGLRFSRRTDAHATQSKVYYWNSAAGWTEITIGGEPYLIDDDYMWHRLALQMQYHQGLSAAGGYFKYAGWRWDDYGGATTRWATPPASDGTIATAGVQKAWIYLIARTDGANASTVYVDDVGVYDSTAYMGL